MSRLGSRLGPLSGSAIGLLLLTQKLPWYERASPFLFLGGPLAAAVLSLGAIVKLDIRRESDQVVATITLTPHRFNVVVAVLSAVLLAILVGYILAENLGST